MLLLTTAILTAVAPLQFKTSLASLRGGSAASSLSAAEREAALRAEYERYKAAVEMPLTNFDEETAQRTQAIRVPGLLSRADIEDIHRAAAELAQQRPDASIDRSAWGQPKGTWIVTFLNTAGAFEAALPELYARVRDAALAVDREHWHLTAGVADINYRVAEYHTMHSSLDGQPTRGGLHTVRHCDQGSLITIDVLLTELSEIEGGVLQTLEADGTLLSHEWEQGDALVFLSHKCAAWPIAPQTHSCHLPSHALQLVTHVLIFTSCCHGLCILALAGTIACLS